MAKKNIMEDAELFSLVNLTDGYRLSDFTCSIKEYEIFLNKESLDFQQYNISKTYLLINKQNADIVAYMALVSDSIKLSQNEIGEYFPDGTVPFTTFPAIKIGKLSVCDEYKEVYSGIGSLMIELARGIAEEINESVSCKFITVDADVENDAGLTDFYMKNHFVPNEEFRKRTRTISMRLNIFEDPQDDIVALEESS